MADLKIGLNDDDILLSAYRALCSWLNESLGLMSQTIPKTKPKTQTLSVHSTEQKFFHKPTPSLETTSN